MNEIVECGISGEPMIMLLLFVGLMFLIRKIRKE